MSIASILSPIAEFLRSSFLYLSKLDGKAGLTVADFEVVLGWVKQASYSYTTNEVKADMVKNLLVSTFGAKVPTWLVDVMVWLAYAYAKRKGLV